MPLKRAVTHSKRFLYLGGKVKAKPVQTRFE